MLCPTPANRSGLVPVSGTEERQSTDNSQVQERVQNTWVSLPIIACGMCP